MFKNKQNVKSFLVVVSLSILVSATRCAVQHSKAPQITPQTTFELNTSNQLQQFQNDYKKFFTDVGNAQRVGTLSMAQVGQLNIIGDKIKLSLESANRTFRAYMVTHDEPTRLQVVNLVN